MPIPSIDLFAIKHLPFLALGTLATGALISLANMVKAAWNRRFAKRRLDEIIRCTGLTLGDKSICSWRCLWEEGSSFKYQASWQKVMLWFEPKEGLLSEAEQDIFWLDLSRDKDSRRLERAIDRQFRRRARNLHVP